MKLTLPTQYFPSCAATSLIVVLESKVITSRFECYGQFKFSNNGDEYPFDRFTLTEDNAEPSE